MANMFSGKSDKLIPKTLAECTQRDATVTNLHIWAERLESWGQILFVILIIIGIISTITDTVTMADIDEDMAFMTCITSAITWGIYAFIEYCAYHVLALLISALASITQNTIISANVALYEASGNTYAENSSQPTTSNSTTTAKPIHTLGVRSTLVADKWICAHCKTSNSTNYSQCKKCGQYRSL